MNEVPTAFPWTHDNVTCTGMTLRDYFAAKAMQGMLSGLLAEGQDIEWKGIAINAYWQADEMMKVREA